MAYRPLTEDSPLTIKEEKFVQRYLETGNGTQSIFDAGYNYKSTGVAATQANNLLKKPNVAKKIREYREKVQTAHIATAQEVMEYFTRVMKGEEKDQFGLDAPLSERTRAAQELAKRTVDLDNRMQGKADNVIEIKLDWGRD